MGLRATAFLLLLTLSLVAQIPAPTPSMSSTFGQPKPTVKAPAKPAGFLFEFKDGSRFRGKVFNGGMFGANVGANADGLILQSLDGRIYVHHYPPVNRRPARAYNSFAGYTPNGDGTYSPVDQAIPEPPTSRIEINPTPLPSCIPARISFMQFKRSTLNRLYPSYEAAAKRDIANGMSYSINKDITWAIYNAANGRTPIGRHNSPVAAQRWRGKVVSEGFLRNRWVIYGGR